MCNKVCPSNDKLYTHFRGAHGKGYTAPCGFWTQWPGKRARHQVKCDPCIEFLAIKSSHKQPVQFKSDAKKIKLENIKTETVVKKEPKVKTETDRKFKFKTIKTEKSVKEETKVKTETDLKQENGIKDCKVKVEKLKVEKLKM